MSSLKKFKYTVDYENANLDGEAIYIDEPSGNTMTGKYHDWPFTNRILTMA